MNHGARRRRVRTARAPVKAFVDIRCVYRRPPGHAVVFVLAMLDWLGEAAVQTVLDLARQAVLRWRLKLRVLLAREI